MALKMGKDCNVSKINKNMMEDGQQAKRKDMESYFTMTEAITKEIFQITKSMVKGNIVGLAKVFIKVIGFIIKSVE